MNPKPIDPSAMADSPLTGSGPPDSNAEGSSLHQCSKCLLWQPPNAFRKTRHGLRPKCRSCTNKEYRAYYSLNRDAKRRKCRAYHQANRERMNKRSAQWYKANRDRANKLSAEWKRRNKSRVLNWRKQYDRSHRKQIAQQQNLRRARKIGQAAGAKLTEHALNSRWSMWGDRCYICGAPATASDHVIALVRGGPHCLSNLRPICKPCNSSKKHNSLPEFLTKKGISLWKQPIPRLP